MLKLYFICSSHSFILNEVLNIESKGSSAVWWV